MSKNILVIDDEENLRESFVLALKDTVYNADTAETGEKGIEKERNKKISKKRYIVEQYFGLSHLHDRAKRARFTTIIKNIIDAMFRQMAYNLSRGSKLLGFT